MVHDRFEQSSDIEELATRAATGDAHALDTLLRRIRPLVLRRCAGVLMYQADAEEACQDALLQVARHIGDFAGRSRFTTWLHVVVTNCARQTYRTLKRRAAEQMVDEFPTQPLDPRTTSVIAGARIDLLEALDRLEQRTPELVAAFVLRDLADLEYDEIARQTGMPTSTVRFRIQEARKFVRRYLIDVSPA
jgi:RNA polymerase sigma factor (sigma-70 family)